MYVYIVLLPAKLFTAQLPHALCKQTHNYRNIPHGIPYEYSTALCSHDNISAYLIS